ncbi:uncharacterized protein LOC117252739 [Epinephelus lanceolatus]
MQISSLLQVIFALSSPILSKARDVIGSGPSCLNSSLADDGQTRVTFLRQDAAGVRTLYLTLWSEDTRLVGCKVETNPRVTERYRTHCESSGTQGQEITQRLNISMLFAPESPCARTSSAQEFTRRRRSDGTEGKTRMKRSWLFPGTLWCGHGSRARSYEQLGMFKTTDTCCREHDHCLHIILGRTTKYGLFNNNFYTVSHCDCDQRFRECLLNANDTAASIVGYSFFNILQIPCFELKQEKRCAEMHWWGGCKVVKKDLYAVLRNPHPYNSSSKYRDNTDNSVLTSSEGQHGNKSSVYNPHRKSPKSERRCRSRDPPKGDTFPLRRRKGKGCKRHRKLYSAVPSEIPPTSRAHTTTPSMKTGLFNVTKSSTLMPNKKRGGSTGKGLSAYSTQRSRVSPQVTTYSYSQTTSTTQSTPSSTEKPKLQLHSTTTSTTTTTTTATITKTTRSHKKVSKLSHCCGPKMPVRGDSFQPHCKNCLERNTTSNMTTSTPSTTTYRLPVKVATANRLKKTTETTKQDTLTRLWSTTTSVTPVTTKLKTTASTHKDGKSPPLQNNTSKEPLRSTIAQSTHAGRSLKENITLHNITDSHLLCVSLKHLDECRYKIRPSEMKYRLKNTESKTAYHCNCTSRLAVQIESIKKASILPMLLMDFVSQYCFRLPEGKKCHRRKSCSGGFTKASDLLQALKMIEEKDTAGVRNSGNFRRRGIPVRLYKRCLRLEKEAAIMAQLTRF